MRPTLKEGRSLTHRVTYIKLCLARNQELSSRYFTTYDSFDYLDIIPAQNVFQAKLKL